MNVPYRSRCDVGRVRARRGRYGLVRVCKRAVPAGPGRSGWRRRDSCPVLGAGLAGVVATPPPGALAIVFGLTVLVSGYGLFFYFNDWYWPQPTQPNPWRVWMVPVVIVPQWAAISMAAVALLAHRLWSTRRRATATLGAAADRTGTR